jgi:hypothetical protein
MNHRRKYILAGGVLLLAVSLFISCYPGDELTVSDTDTIVTLFDEAADFSQQQTYAMDDNIVHLVEDGDEDNITRAHDAEILAQIEANMATLGYDKVDDPALADVNILVSVSVRDYTGYAYTGGYWGGWYGGYYPPGWGWYPYYPSSGYTYSYSIGTIFIMMTDPPRVTPDGDPIPPIWIAALNGLADTGTTVTRIQNGIDQAFAQSLYLGEGK